MREMEEKKPIKNTCLHCDRTGKYSEQSTTCKYCGKKVDKRYISNTGKMYIDGKYFGHLDLIDTLMHIEKNNLLIYVVFQILLALMVSVPVAVLTIKLSL